MSRQRTGHGPADWKDLGPCNGSDTGVHFQLGAWSSDPGRRAEIRDIDEAGDYGLGRDGVFTTSHARNMGYDIPGRHTMNCTACGAPTTVIDVRARPGGGSIRRRRRCPDNHRFTTIELKTATLAALASDIEKALAG